MKSSLVLLQLILLVFGLTYVFSVQSVLSVSSSDATPQSEINEKEYWIKLRHVLKQTMANVLTINTFIQTNYNDFQDLDEHITGADDASKNYFNDVLVKQFDEINMKANLVQEELKTAKQLVSERMALRDYPRELSTINDMLLSLVNPYDNFKQNWLNTMNSFKRRFELAFTSEENEEESEKTKEVIEAVDDIKNYFRPAKDGRKRYSSLILSIQFIRRKINQFISLDKLVERLDELDFNKRNSKEDNNKSKRKERTDSFKPESSSRSNKREVESESKSREYEENPSKKMKVSIPDKPID